MITEKRLSTYNKIALWCAIWFLLFGWFWTFFINILLVYPFAIIGLILWRKGRAAEKKRLNKIVGWMLLAGIIISVGCLITLMIF